ncbi:MAG: hypothetical protein LBE22_06805 [Azoarcus sp.]|nr:hypothetical protein [Azoarcus sp.]
MNESNQSDKRVVRCPVLFDPRYPAEKELLDMLGVVPKGEKAFFLRELIMCGLKEEQRHGKSGAGQQNG